MKLDTKLEIDILRPITECELIGLIDLYKRNGDKYHCMSMYNDQRWMKKLEAISSNHDERWLPMKKIYYTHRYGNLPVHGTYISLQWDKCMTVQFHTFEKSLEELHQCISETKLIDWRSGPLLSAINTDISNKITEFIMNQGGIVDYEIPCPCFVLAHSIALNLEIPSVPEGYVLRPLLEKHADFIHSQWPHGDSASKDFIRGMINLNLTYGIFKQDNGKLIAWSFQNEFYGIGILQVIPEEQGKGFAKILIRTLAKEIALLDGNDITTHTVENNTKPQNIIRKIGFERDCVATWIKLKNLAQLF